MRLVAHMMHMYHMIHMIHTIHLSLIIHMMHMMCVMHIIHMIYIYIPDTHSPTATEVEAALDAQAATNADKAKMDTATSELPATQLSGNKRGAPEPEVFEDPEEPQEEEISSNEEQAARMNAGLPPAEKRGRSTTPRRRSAEAKAKPAPKASSPNQE